MKISMGEILWERFGQNLNTVPYNELPKEIRESWETQAIDIFSTFISRFRNKDLHSYIPVFTGDEVELSNGVIGTIVGYSQPTIFCLPKPEDPDNSSNRLFFTSFDVVRVIEKDKK